MKMMEELQEAVRGAASSNRRWLGFVSVFCPLSARRFSSLLDYVKKWLLLLLHLLPLPLLTVLHQLARFFGAAVKLSRKGLWLDEDGEKTSALQRPADSAKSLHVIFGGGTSGSAGQT